MGRQLSAYPKLDYVGRAAVNLQVHGAEQPIGEMIFQAQALVVDSARLVGIIYLKAQVLHKSQPPKQQLVAHEHARLLHVGPRAAGAGGVV